MMQPVSGGQGSGDWRQVNTLKTRPACFASKNRRGGGHTWDGVVVGWKRSFAAITQGPPSPKLMLLPVSRIHTEASTGGKTQHNTVIFLCLHLADKEVARGRTDDRTDICQECGTATVCPLTRMTCLLMPFLEKLSYASFCPRVRG